GCANGEEAYSICILFQQAAIRHRKELALQIFATDIDDHALERARRGVYSGNQVKDVDPEILQSYFRERDGHFQISKRIRDQVVFARQNLVMDPPFSHLDLISCRNVLIYFNLETQRTILQVFHFALKRHGHLFLGKSESASNTTPELFDALYKTSQIFVRRSTAVSTRADQIASAGRMSQLRASRKPERFESPADTPSTEHDPIKSSLERVLLDSVVPVAIALDGQGNIHHIRGDVGRFLSFPQGRIDTTIFSLARDDLRLDIRSLLQRAKREGRASSQALFYRHEDENRSLFLRLCKLDLPEQADLYLLVFIDLDLDEGARLLEASANDPASLSYQQLEEELVIFRKRLQSSVEDLEATNEALQSTNEELQSANEELQSSNEELQTANEELQSTNEELSTVNQELEVKTFELEQVNNDLESMLSSIDQIILFIDNRLRLQRFTRKAAETFGLGGDDLRQPVTSMGYVVDVPHLRLELLNVIELEKEGMLRANLEAGYFNLRLVPYKAEKDAVVGVIMFFESDGQHGPLRLGRMAQAQLQLLSRVTEHAVIAIDPHGRIVYADERVAALFAYEPGALLGENIKLLMPEPFRGHHDGYLREFEQGQSKGVIGRWRSVTGLDRRGNRFIAQLRIEGLGDEQDRLYVGLFTVPENAER
ncbi:MAG: CheR family methyltransferase, partial [Halothiobacillaceae bacterium]